VSGAGRLSADGLFYWDGSRWISALSPDARHRWDGSRWVPLQVAQAAAPRPRTFAAPPARAIPPRIVRNPTSWTKPLQSAIAGWYALQSALTVGVATLIALHLNDFVTGYIQAQERAHPNDALPPPGLAESLTVTAAFFIFFAVAISLGIYVTIIVGALKRWVWVHYAVLLMLGLAILGLPFGFAAALGLFSYPGVAREAFWVGVAGGALSTALFAWMLMAVLRRGPWAMNRRELAAQE